MQLIVIMNIINRLLTLILNLVDKQIDCEKNGHLDGKTTLCKCLL